MTTKIDTEDNKDGLYSRQLYVLDHEAMKSLGNSNVLISGMGGLGVDTSKNVILSGPKSVTIHDTKRANMFDLSSQFYLKKEDIGKNRAMACLNRLKELNAYVDVKCSTEDLNEEFLGGFNVIVLTDHSLEEQIRINEFCRKKKIAFINARTLGLSGQIFCDFGNDFVIRDIDGEQPSNCIIEVLAMKKKHW